MTNLRQVALIESTESSNRIEGITAPHERIEALITKHSQPENRSEQEIAGYRDALNLLHQSADQMPFSSNVVQQLHQYLYRYMAQNGGKWKVTDNTISEVLEDGTRHTRFIPTSAMETPFAMDQLLEIYRYASEDEQKEALLLIPLAVFDFLCIHPFLDGNGRTARLITLQLLYHHDYQVGRYISLERVIEESKESYYESLRESSEGWHEGKHNVGPWLRYFWGTLLRAYQEFEERVGTITGKKLGKSEQIRTMVVQMIGPFTTADLEKRCPGISRDTILAVLRELRGKRQVELLGKGRGARWQLLPPH